MGSKLCVGAVVVAGLSFLAAADCVGAPAIHPLDPLTGGVASYAQAVNGDGLAVGYSTTAGSVDLPTLWRPSDAGGAYVAEALPLPAGMASGGANAINSSGLIVGYAQPADGSTAAAVVWAPTGTGGAYVASTLAGLGAGMNYNAAYGVNAAGQVVGFGGNLAGDSVAMTWAAGVGGGGGVGLPPVTTLTAGYTAAATGVNDAGDVVGYGGVPGSVVWRPDGAGGYVRHEVLAADAALVTAISRNGTGAGVYAGDEPLVMALYEGDYYATSLPMPYGSTDGASDGVNSYDGLVGYAKDATTGESGPEAALWVPTDEFWDYVNLDQWLGQQSASLGLHWRLTEATGINDRWLVVGDAMYSKLSSADLVGRPWGFVLDVSSLVPEPSLTGVLLVFVGAGVMGGWRRRRAS